MDFTNSLAYRKKRFKDARKTQMMERQNKLKTQSEQFSNIEYQRNDIQNVTPGLSSGFSTPILVSTLGVDSDLFPSGDEPTRIRSLLIKSQFTPLSTKEVDTIQRHFYMEDLKSKTQSERDKQFILGETYKIAKKSIGLNGKPLII